MSKAEVAKPDLGRFHLNEEKALYQLSVDQLIQESLDNGEGTLADSGALAIDSGTFTGRSPKDRFIVRDVLTRDSVCWGDVNIPFEPQHFEALLNQVIQRLNRGKFYVRDASVCADPVYRMSLRIITETAGQNLFARHLFLRPEDIHPEKVQNWTIISVPSFRADPQRDHTRQANFSILNFKQRILLIGGTGYTGEIKKGIFSALNFILPLKHHVLPMHCSANQGSEGDTAIFFGLSGTGKTTLSADPARRLIGDDEHGWGEQGIFNFEGGCYAKCVGLSAEKEPQIFNAIRKGAILENINYFPGTRTVDFSNIEKTENTRLAYPLDFINDALIPSIAAPPAHIFLLTADAFGVLPPISRLNAGQAMFHFLSGYTAKVAGTEAGITEPQATFSACFGKAFLPLHPMAYAELLGEKLKDQGVKVWLINTGWTGGPYGSGSRIKLNHTRAMISAALEGKLDGLHYDQDPVFGLHIPESCPGVPSELLNPRNTWPSPQEYDLKAAQLAGAFLENFRNFEDQASQDMLSALPKAGR